MNRRSFLSMLAATAVLDPERLLWVPGAKTIFIPARVKKPIVVQWYRYSLNWKPGAVIEYGSRTDVEVTSDWIHEDLNLKETKCRTS